MKRYIIEFDGWQAELDVDVKKAAPACLECLNFFDYPISRKETDEGTVQTFMEFIAPRLAEYSMHNTEEGVSEQFGDLEGHFALDGSKGITLVYCDQWEWHRESFTIGRS